MSDVIKRVEEKFSRKELPKFSVGDVVKVYTSFKEGERLRTQIFEGVVISKRGSGMGRTFKVRKISYGEGVEKVFSVHSPSVEKVEVVRHGKVKRAKLYYLKERIGKRATRVKERIITEGDKEDNDREVINQAG